MNYDATLLNYFLHASVVVKCVMLLLVAASIFSWSFILQRFFYLQNVKRSTSNFEEKFTNNSAHLLQLYADLKNKSHVQGLQAIFLAGYREYLRVVNKVPLPWVVKNTQRAMDVAQMREQERLETHLPFLAIVGSTSPYIGLFGTVWGIMQAFRALANVSQATIAMVAPGIAEALIATALGLFAAIPAVIAYNRFLTDSGKLLNCYDAFKEEFINALIRTIHEPQQHFSPLGKNSPQETILNQGAFMKKPEEMDLIENTVE